MADEKAKIGFSLDLGDTKAQLDRILKGLKGVKSGLKQTGSTGETSFNRLNLGLSSVFKNITLMSTKLRKSVSQGSKLSKRELTELLNKSKNLQERLGAIHAKTAAKMEKSEGKKREALTKTLKVQESAIKGVGKLGDATIKTTRDMTKAFTVLGSIITIKVASVFKTLIKDATILAARNQVLGTAMRTVGQNAGISNAELTRSESTIRKLGISINDTRELISRFAQAQLGMESATKLARAAQDLAAGSILGSSEALRIMTQSILSLLPRQLRQFGVVVNLNQVYKEQSRILGKSVNDLTSLEKRQGLLNKIFEEAAKRTGAYERSMQDAGKVMTTLSSRIIPDTLSMFGDELLPIFSALIFAFQDILKWLQALSPAWKNFISALVVGITTILSVKAALVMLGGTLGFVKAGFAGAATSAATASASFGPLIIAIGAIAAALIVLPKLFGDAENAQEKMLKSSQGMLDVEVERLNNLKSLKVAVENQSATESDLRKIIEINLKRHKELVPLLKKEVIIREDIIEILDREITKRKEAVKVALDQTKELNEAQIDALKDQQKNVGNMITSLTLLHEKYGEGEIPIVTLIATMRGLRGEIEDSGRNIEGLDEQFTTFYGANIDNLNKLKRAFADLGAKIRESTRNGEEDFGLAAKGIIASVSEMRQAFLAMETRLDKMAEKTSKKFIFKSLIEDQQAFSKDLIALSVTAEQRYELLIKARKVFHDRFTTAELKFQEKLESFGATDLQKIEAKRKKETKLYEGSAIAIAAVEKEAVVKRNAVFTKMWDDRLALTKASTSSIIDIIKIERDTALGQASANAKVAISRERLAADEIITIRNNLKDQKLAIITTSQNEEFSVRKQHFNAVANQLATLLNTNVINEQQFSERAKVLALDLKNFRQAQLTERLALHKSSLDQLYSEEVRITDNIKGLDQEQVAAARSTEATLRSLKQQTQTDIQNFNEDRKRASELLSEGEKAIRENDFVRAKEISQQVKGLALSTNKIVREDARMNARVLITADEARIGSIELVKKAGALLQKSIETQRDAEVTAFSKVEDKILQIKTAIDLLVSEKKQIEVEIAGDAEKEIDAIKKKLDALKDKTVTVTVVTNYKTVGSKGASKTAVAATGGESVGGGDGGDGGDGLAEGAVDIQGPGTYVSDSIVTMLSRGESVITAAATRMFKPLLELMNANPEGLSRAFATSIKAGAVGAGSSVTNANTSTKFGDIAININGVAASDVQNIDWRRVVRKKIWPELKKFEERKSAI